MAFIFVFIVTAFASVEADNILCVGSILRQTRPIQFMGSDHKVYCGGKEVMESEQQPVGCCDLHVTGTQHLQTLAAGDRHLSAMDDDLAYAQFDVGVPILIACNFAPTTASLSAGFGDLFEVIANCPL